MYKEILIVGDLFFRDYEKLKTIMTGQQDQRIKIVTSNHRGACALSKQYARDNEIPCHIEPIPYPLGRLAMNALQDTLLHRKPHIVLILENNTENPWRSIMNKIQKQYPNIPYIHYK